MAAFHFRGRALSQFELELLIALARSLRPLDVHYWRKQCERGVKKILLYQVNLNNLNASYIRRFSGEQIH